MSGAPTRPSSAGDVPRRELEEIFQLAADLAGEERSRLLDEKCAARPALRAEIENLLRELDGGTKGLLATTPVLPAEAMDAPRQIGEYRILRELGRGGMGVVYQAEQARPKRMVALKVMRWDVLSPSGIKRFRREAEVLGQLKHPGIAQIHELGTLKQDGHEQPFIAMEYVDGPDLATYCKKRELSVQDRLRLIARLCEAVQYAHGRGVIHRDLKPGNVLVEQYATGELGQPKILDFGIARATEGETRSATLETQVGQVVGTLAYMSPEQASGDPHAIDARCDVYALGAIAYELLTGRVPLEVSGRTLPEAMRIVIENDPPTLRTIVPGLRGDVDAIVGKALEKQVARRYQSAAELGADIERYLRGEAVQARPASTAYQLSKFARRNKALVGGIAAVMLALAAGLATTLVMYGRVQDEREVAQREALRAANEAKRATREAERVTAIRDYLVADLIESASPERDGYQVKVIDVLKRAGEGVGKRFEGNADLEMDVRALLATVFRRLGMREELLEQQKMYLDYYLSLKDPPKEKLANAYGGMASALNFAGRQAESEQLARTGLKVIEGVTIEDASVPLSLKTSLGSALHVQGKAEEAEPLLREVLAESERIRGREHGQTLTIMSQLSASLYAQKRVDEALAIAKDQMARSESAYSLAHPASLAARNAVVTYLSGQGNRKEAWTFAREIPEAAEKTFPEGHPMRAYAYMSAGASAMWAEEYEQAERLLLRGHERSVAIFGPGAYETEQATNNVRNLYRRIKNDAMAIEWGRRAAQMRFKIAGPGEFESLIKSCEQLDTDLKKRNLPPGTPDTLDWLALHADEAVPEGSRSRARYLGNVGRLLVSVDRLENGERMLKLAEAALGTGGVDAAGEQENRKIIYSALATLAQVRGDADAEARYRAEENRKVELADDAAPVRK